MTCLLVSEQSDWDTIKIPSTPQSIEIDGVPYRVLDLFKRTC